MKSKISFIGKLITIISSIVTIIFASGTWLDLYQVPMIFGNSVQHEYTLYEISDFMDTFNMYLQNSNVDFYSGVLSFGVTIVIILSVLDVVMSILDMSLSKITTILTTIASVILVCVFVGSVHNINREFSEATYGGIKEIIRNTANPYWCIVFATVGCVGVRIKKKISTDAKTNISQESACISCNQCGTINSLGSSFCNECGCKLGQDTESDYYCTSCGNKLAKESSFCTACGNKVEKQ